MLFDSHAHLDNKKFSMDCAEVIKNAKEKGIGRIINVGADLESSYASLELARKYKFIFCSCGIHPHDAGAYSDDVEKQLEKIAEDRNIVAIGEIGLDYYYDNSPREIQKEVYARQINLANRLKLPLIIHDRDAHKDCMDILKAERTPETSGVFHCYSGSNEMVKEIINLGFYISFTGVITFKNARKTLDALRAVPLNRLLVETDCPYMSPEPKRGRRNMPEYVEYTAKKMAEIKGVDYEKLCRIIWKNTHKLFGRLPNSVNMIE